MTGYTQAVVEKDQTFEQFAMSCARAFGALIEMRDDPMDAAIPEEFKPSGYRNEAIISSGDELKRLISMTASEAFDYGAAKIKADIDYTESRISEIAARNGKLKAMIEKVRQWEPPSPDHTNLKEFMIKQLNESIESPQYSEDNLALAKQKDAMQEYSEAIKQIMRNIEYHQKEMAKEAALYTDRNQWIRQLRESLKPAQPVKS